MERVSPFLELAKSWKYTRTVVIVLAVVSGILLLRPFGLGQQVAGTRQEMREGDIDEREYASAPQPKGWGFSLPWGKKSVVWKGDEDDHYPFCPHCGQQYMLFNEPFANAELHCRACNKVAIYKLERCNHCKGGKVPCSEESFKLARFTFEREKFGEVSMSYAGNNKVRPCNGNGKRYGKCESCQYVGVIRTRTISDKEHIFVDTTGTGHEITPSLRDQLLGDLKEENTYNGDTWRTYDCKRCIDLWVETDEACALCLGTGEVGCPKCNGTKEVGIF